MMIFFRFFIFIITLFCGVQAFAKEYSPSDIVNPNIADRRVYIADPANLVGKEAKDQANRTLWQLRQAAGAEVVLVVVPNTGEYSREQFATKLFDDWKPGKSDKDNGVIILIVPDQREAWIATGYGVEGIIPDISAARIINRSVVPYMKDGNLDAAVAAVSADVANVLSDPEAAEELKSKEAEAWDKAPESDITGEDVITFLIFVVIAIAIFGYVSFFVESNKFKKKDRYNQARAWHENLNFYKFFAIFSLGLALFPYLYAKRRYRKLRNEPMTCPACKGKMKKLNEEEDNNLLSPSQDFEEKINSVDYDVWVCDDCGFVERYAFPNKNSKYEVCPHCATRAMTLVTDRTVTPATTKRTGIGERVYECRYCHNNTYKRYTIPKKEDGTAAALAAGAILGSGRSGGGGGFGGGFGGGHTGGGGGGGRW